jgi:hypothetical protein
MLPDPHMGRTLGPALLMWKQAQGLQDATQRGPLHAQERLQTNMRRGTAPGREDDPSPPWQLPTCKALCLLRGLQGQGLMHTSHRWEAEGAVDP